jgi:lipid-A-disaccharide synthase
MTRTASTSNILVIAGEVSGDMHAARVIAELKSRRPDVDLWGIGGPRLAETGMEVVYGIDQMAVMGISEVLRRLPFFKKVFNEVLRMAETRKPQCAVLVDYPGFNLRLARRLKEMGICVIYYICPQVWAWNSGRITRMAQWVDRLITIFPFEPDLFKGTGLQVDFVGHPLVDEAKAAMAEPPAQLPWAGQPRIGLLPGSRTQEIRRMLPLMKQAARQVEKTFPDASFLIASPSNEMAELSRNIMRRNGRAPRHWQIVPDQTRQVLRQSRAILTASGTATIEAALLRCPMVVTYKAGWIEFSLAKLLIRIRDIAMVNVVAGRRVCPEYVQHHARPQALANALIPLLKDSSARHLMLKELEKVREELGEGKSEARAAKIIEREFSKQEHQVF